MNARAVVACLVNGNIVIGWRARLPGPLLVHLQIFDANGPVGGAALASEASGQRGDSMVRAPGTRPEPGSSAREQTTSLDITEAAMTALNSGRFVIAHIRSAFDGEPGFETTIAQASVFEASGAFTNIRFAATAASRIQSSWPTLAPLPGGRFLLAWTEVNVDNVAAGINVKARIFSPAQGPIGQVTQFNTSAGSQRFSLSAATTSGPEGEIAFAAWTDDSQSGGDPSGRAVRGRPLSILPGGF